ncbi:MAG TPA: RHS repeat-associated core domain-containing protein [Chryseolinea sp.]
MKRTLHIFLACVTLTLFGTLQAQTLYPMQWINVVGATVNADQSLTKTGANGWISGAASTNLLRAGVDGQVQFTWTGATGQYMVGLSRTDKDVNYNSIEYGIAYSSGVISVIQSGNSVGTYGTPQANEVFKVVRTGNTIYYYRSSSTMPMATATLSNIYNSTFLVDVSVSSGIMPVVQASFDVALNISASVTPVSYGGINGGISVSVTQGTGPYTYSWSSGETTSSISGKPVGTYTVTVTDAVGHVTPKSISIGYKPNWTDLVGGVSVDVNKNLVKTGNNAWDGGAASYNILPEGSDGWLEFAWTNSWAYEIGLSRRNLDASTSVEYGLYVLAGGDINIYESGTLVGTFGRAASGDIFRIVKDGVAMKYYHNGVVLRSVNYATLDASFFVDVSIYYTGAIVPPIMTSFDSRIAIKKTITPVQSAAVGGAVVVTPSGGMPPYTYSWTGGGTTNRIENKPAGIYYVTVADAEGRTAAYSIGLGYEIDWTLIDSKLLLLDDNSFSRGGTKGWDAGSSSVNMLLPQAEGWIEFEVDSGPGSVYEIGLSTGDANYSYTGIDNGLMANLDGSFYSFKRTAAQPSSPLALIKVGDVFRVSREAGGSLVYYKNGAPIFTTTITAVPQVVDISVYQGKTPVIYSSFDTRLNIVPTLRPLDANGQNASINVSIKGGRAPYAVSWTTGETGSVLSGKDLGAYKATVTDKDGRTVSKTYRTGYAVEWGSLVGATRESNYTLRKAGGTASWTAGAFSRNVMAADTDGWIEFVSQPGLVTAYAVGLSTSNPNASYTNIGYSFLLNTSNTISIYENGTYIGDYGYVSPGDVFTITRTSKPGHTSTISYYINGGDPVRTVSVNACPNLYVDATINTPNVTIPAVMGSFKRDLVTIDQRIRNNWAFEYKYDDRQRMIAKKAPGAEWVYMIYDNRDRLVLTQDGNQRVTNEWLYTKYDALNRPVQTGIYKHATDEVTQETLQNFVDGKYPDANSYYEDYVGTTAGFGYTTRSFPTTSITPLTVNYYDDYQFKTLYSDPRFDFVTDHLNGQQPIANDRVKGQVTGTLVRSLNDAFTWMESVNYYDDKYRVIQRVEEDHQGKISRHTSLYDFVGKVMETNSTQGQAYDVVWKVAGCQVDNSDNKLIWTGGTWTGGGYSTQVLAAAQDGWVEHVFDGASTNIVGLSAADGGPDAGSIGFGAYVISAGQLYSVFKGTPGSLLKAIKKGDVIRVERIGTAVVIRLNGDVLYTFTTASTSSLIADVSMAQGTIQHARTSFGADKTQATALAWAYATTMTIANNTLTKTATSNNLWNAYAVSQNILSGPGWIQFKALETDKFRMAGLASISPIRDYNDLDYAFYLQTGGVFSIREGSQTIYTGNYVAGDVFRIESNGDAITYIRNNQAIPGLPPSAKPTKAYRFQAAMYTKSSTLAEVAVSFGIPMTEQKTDLYSRFEYDHAGRLKKEWQKINSDPEVLLTANDYNELGQLVTKKLFNTVPATDQTTPRQFKQEVDYRYNIRGWLTRINNSDLTPDNGSPVKDLFGMELAYEKPMTNITTGSQVAFNGNISAIRWSNNLGLGGIDNPTQRAYRYSYDAMNRLTTAEHFELAASWNTNPSYKESIIAADGVSSGYDLNGNILSLQRTGKDGAGIDVLTYSYGTDLQRSNKLLAVADAPNADADVRDKGFKDGANTALDYSYDPNGNMVSDLNKDVQSITYNYLNLPTRVNKTTGEYVKYIYDATGRKLAQQVFDASNAMIKRSDYVGSLFLENDTLKFISHAEGRIIPAKANTETNEYQYHLKDHLGNVRLTFTTKDETETSMATLEPDHADEDRAKFLYYDEAIKVRNHLFDHTNNVNNGDPAVCTGLGTVDGYATRLTGGNTNAKYGLAQSISVMPGDVVSMEVWAKYVDLSQEDPQGALATFITSLGSAASIASGVYIDGGAAGSMGAMPLPIIPVDHTSDNSGNATPKAYLNFVFLDRDMNQSSTDFGFAPVTTAAIEHGQNGCHERLSLSYNVKQPGYLYIYLSNDNPQAVEVYFDDFKVEHVKSPVVQQQDYYPFGLSYNSYQRENSVKQNYLYNGKELQDELDLSWLDYGARMYQPDIAHWSVIDPLSEKMRRYSPYAYAFDNPIRFTDPDGRAAKDVVIGGDKKDDVFKQLQKSTSLKLSMDGNGKVTATGKAKTDADKKLMAATTDKKVVVKVNATSSNYSQNGKWFAGGAFGGSEVKEDGKVEAKQTVNPGHTEKIDEMTNAPKGTSVLHEVLEAYIGATDSPGSGAPTFEDVANKTKNGVAYESAHNKAEAADPRHKAPNTIVDPSGVYISKYPYNPNMPAILNPEVLLFKFNN